MGDPEPDNEKINGFIPAGQSKPRNVPLEIFVAGDKEPIYSSTIEEDGRGSAQTKLPFQSFGALGMAREEYDDDSASSQFFWLLFDSDLTPAGKNMLDGRYGDLVLPSPPTPARPPSANGWRRPVGRRRKSVSVTACQVRVLWVHGRRRRVPLGRQRG